MVGRGDGVADAARAPATGEGRRPRARRGRGEGDRAQHLGRRDDPYPRRRRWPDAATATAPVSGDSVEWIFRPRDHGITACVGVIAVVEGGGQKAESTAALHVHQPYWDAADGSLRYELQWPPPASKSPEGSTHWY